MIFRWLSVFIFFLNFQLCGEESGQPVVYSKTIILETFFRDLLENTPAGYVLYGRKPVYLHSFLGLEKTIPGSKAHEFSALTSLFLETWGSCSVRKEGADCLLVEKDNEFLLINRKEFIRVVTDNLSLFQYKMGIDISPEGLLASLSDPVNTFSSLFREEIALQGILLGYGTGNSITYEKGTRLIKSLKDSTISFPLRSSPWPKTEGEMIQKLDAAFGLKKNGKQEMQDLSFYKSSDKNDRLKIPFSFHPHTQESKHLLSCYREDQKSVDAILSDKNFLNKILLTLNALESDRKTEIFFAEEEKKLLPEVVTQFIVNSFQEEMGSFFIDGMKAAERNVPLQEDKGVKFLEIQKNHTLSATGMTVPSAAKCIIPKKLYFQILKQGSSEKILSKSHQQLKVCYLARTEKDLSGQILLVDLKDLIPGLSHAMLGMNEGEIREIFVHPDFVYGIDSDYGNGTPLRVRIELLELGALGKESELPLFSKDDPYAPDVFSCSEFIQLQHKYFYYCGAATWGHYKKLAPWIRLDDVLQAVEKGKVRHLLPEEKRLLLKLEWFLYGLGRNSSKRI